MEQSYEQVNERKKKKFRQRYRAGGALRVQKRG